MKKQIQIDRARKIMEEMTDAERREFNVALETGESENVPYQMYNAIAKEKEMCPLSAYIAMKMEAMKCSSK